MWKRLRFFKLCGPQERHLKNLSRIYSVNQTNNMHYTIITFPWKQCISLWSKSTQQTDCFYSHQPAGVTKVPRFGHSSLSLHISLSLSLPQHQYFKHGFCLKADSNISHNAVQRHVFTWNTFAWSVFQNLLNKMENSYLASPPKYLLYWVQSYSQ